MVNVAHKHALSNHANPIDFLELLVFNICLKKNAWFEARYLYSLWVGCLRDLISAMIDSESVSDPFWFCVAMPGLIVADYRSCTLLSSGS